MNDYKNELDSDLKDPDPYLVFFTILNGLLAIGSFYAPMKIAQEERKRIYAIPDVIDRLEFIASEIEKLDSLMDAVTNLIGSAKYVKDSSENFGLGNQSLMLSPEQHRSYVDLVMRISVTSGNLTRLVTDVTYTLQDAGLAMPKNLEDVAKEVVSEFNSALRTNSIESGFEHLKSGIDKSRTLVARLERYFKEQNRYEND